MSDRGRPLYYADPFLTLYKPLTLSEPIENIDPSPALGKRFGNEAVRQLRAHAVLIVLCILYFAASVPCNLYFGRPVGVSFWPYFRNIFGFVVPVAMVVFLPLHLIYMMLVTRPKSPLKSAFEFYKSLLFDTNRWARSIPAILIVMLAFSAYSDFKGLIPLMNPYCWDVTFMEIDRSLHFGYDPWQLLQPVFGGAIATQAINFGYNVWFLVMFMFWLSAGWSKSDSGWQRQFLVSFLLAWIIGGTLLAILFSSMGPTFYDLVDANNNPFADQVAWMYAINETHTLWSLHAQEMLREGYLNPAHGKLSGISAMPSMHNATSSLFVFAAFRIHRALGFVMLAFLAVIVIGSVHLAWHYAIDAYAGILIAVFVWLLAERLIQFQDKFWTDCGMPV